MKFTLWLVALALFSILVPTAAHAQACYLPGAGPVDGSDNACTDFRVALVDIGGFEPGFDVTDEGWVWVARSQPGPRRRCVSGYVKGSSVARNDTPANHYSHDEGVGIVVDPGQEGVLSNVNAPNNSDDDNDLVPDDDGQTVTPDEIELEWETGILPSEKSGDGANPIFPKWAWPSKGDRVWVDGNWVFDCGHGKKIGHYETVPNIPVPVFVGAEYFRTEIHPGRAIATMRSQVGTVLGTGTTPVPITATDLYIHGRGGFVTDILNCGMGIILDGVDEDDDGDGDGNPNICPIKTTPIDENFQFEICVPAKPHPAATLEWTIEAGPGDTIPGVAPTIVRGAASPGCANDGDDTADLYDLTTSLQVTIPLAGTGVDPTAVYARKIRAGWVFPDPDLRHLNLTLKRMHLKHDTDEVPTDTGELTFFWMGVNRAPDEWARLADFDVPTHDSCGALCFEHTNTMNNFDDDGECCNGLLNFDGPTFDFYVARGEPYTVRAHGYDQDCYDFYLNAWSDHHLSLLLYIACVAAIDEYGNNDSLTPLPSPLKDVGEDTTFGPPDYGVGTRDLHAWKDLVIPGPSGPQTIRTFDYALRVLIEEIPLGAEDQADLAIEKTCTPTGEVALVGQPFPCTITVRNPGPGLPRAVSIRDTLTGAGGFVLGTPVLTVGTSAPVPCVITGTGMFTCDVGTVPVGGTATVTMQVTPLAGGNYVNTASVSTASTDPNAANNSASVTVDVFIPITLDIKPGSSTNPINVNRGGGVIPVAILTTPTFNALTVNPLSACFGDSGAPSQRDCTESHGRGHNEDVDRDRDIDLMLHFDAGENGIDAGDVTACLIGRTFAGIGVYGCDRVTTNAKPMQPIIGREAGLD